MVNLSRKNITKILILDTLDPVSAVISLGLHISKTNDCRNKQSVYDGKRRFDLILQDLGTEILPKNSILKKDRFSIKCSLEIKRIAGYTSKELKKHPTDGIIWFNKIEKSDIYIPGKIQIETFYGKFVSYLQENK